MEEKSLAQEIVEDIADQENSQEPPLTVELGANQLRHVHRLQSRKEPGHGRIQIPGKYESNQGIEEQGRQQPPVEPWIGLVGPCITRGLQPGTLADGAPPQRAKLAVHDH